MGMEGQLTIETESGRGTMPEYNADQIKMALTAAKDLTAARDARRQDLTPSQADLAERSEIRANRRAAENLLASSFLKAGFEVEKFEELLAQNRSALRRITERRKAEAVERSSSAKETLRHGIEGRRKAIEHLADVTPPESPTEAAPKFYEVLDRPFLIWPTPGVYMHAEQREPWNSWAKFTLDSSSRQGHEEVSFYFLWQNPSDAYEVIHVDAYLVLNGFGLVQSEGGFFDGIRSSTLEVFARLGLLEWWNQPPTSPYQQVAQSQLALYLSVNTGGWFDDDATESGGVSRGFDLHYNFFVVPPGGVVVFDVDVELNSYTGADSGSIHADFAGDFEVLCPAVWIENFT